MPVVSEPWFELPLITEWTKDKASGTYAATNIEKYKVYVRDTPAVFNLPEEVLASINAFDVYVAEQKERAMEEAKHSR